MRSNDAIEIDSTDLTINEQVEKIIEIINKQIRNIKACLKIKMKKM